MLFSCESSIFNRKSLNQVIDNVTQLYGKPNYQGYSSYSSSTYKMEWYYDTYDHYVTLWEYKGSWDILSDYKYITFEQVTKPYRNSRGEPEEVKTFTSGSYQTVDWWYWTQGIAITFINSPYDDFHGWRVKSTYTF